jgi:hypothetical protein
MEKIKNEISNKTTHKSKKYGLVFVAGIIVIASAFIISVQPLNGIGLLANLTSFALWIPQAHTTWKNRKNAQTLKGVSYGTQIIAAANTVLWCVYGLIIHSYWLAMGTVIILPLAIWTIILKLNADTQNKEIL